MCSVSEWREFLLEAYGLPAFELECELRRKGISGECEGKNPCGSEGVERPEEG